MTSPRRPRPAVELTDEDRRIGLENLRRLGFSTLPPEHLELDDDSHDPDIRV